MTIILRLGLIYLLAFPGFSFAAIEAYEFKDAKMESEYNRLINELRCLVCQNQNLAGSDADLARDLRRQTHEMLMEGNNSDQVIEYMVERYGDFVLYRPLFKTSTLFLWLGPFVLIAIVLWLVIRNIRARKALVEPDDTSMQRAKDLLTDDLHSKTRDNS